MERREIILVSAIAGGTALFGPVVIAHAEAPPDEPPVDNNEQNGEVLPTQSLEADTPSVEATPDQTGQGASDTPPATEQNDSGKTGKDDHDKGGRHRKKSSELDSAIKGSEAVVPDTAPVPETEVEVSQASEPANADELVAEDNVVGETASAPDPTEAAAVIKVDTTPAEAPEQSDELTLNENGVIPMSIRPVAAVNNEATETKPEPDLVDKVMDEVASVFAPDPQTELVGTNPVAQPIETIKSQTGATNIYVVGGSVDISPDGTVHASASPGAQANSQAEATQLMPDTAPTANLINENSSTPDDTAQAITPVEPVSSAALSTEQASQSPEVVDGKVKLNSLINRDGDKVDLSRLIAAIETVKEQPTDLVKFPDPTGYYKMTDGDTFADVNYVFNNGEDGSIPTCESERFASSRTIATALFFASEMQAVMDEAGVAGPPMLMDFTSSHGLEHYNGGDFDIHAIYVDGKYDHDLNLAYIKRIVAHRMTDGSSLERHIVSGDAELVNEVNQWLLETYGSDARPHLVYDSSGGHKNHFHVSVDGGGSSTIQELPHATSPNTRTCEPFTSVTDPVMTYAEAAGFGAPQTAPPVELPVSAEQTPVTENDTEDSLTNSNFSRTAQATKYGGYTLSQILGAPNVGEAGSAADLLFKRMGELVATGPGKTASGDSTPPLSLPGTSPSSAEPTDVVSPPASKTTPEAGDTNEPPVIMGYDDLPLEIQQLIGPELSVDNGVTPEQAFERSSKSVMYGGPLNFDQALGPVIPLDDMFTLLEYFGMNQVDAGVISAFSTRETGRHEDAAGDLGDHPEEGLQPENKPSYGPAQMMDLHNGDPLRDPASNLSPIQAIRNAAEMYGIAGGDPWEVVPPKVLTEESLFQAIRLPDRDLGDKREAFDASMRVIARDVMAMIQVTQPKIDAVLGAAA